MAKSILILFFGDATRDRRVQNFSRFFQEHGWNIELLALTSDIPSGPGKFFDYHRRIKKAVQMKKADVVLASDLYSLSASRWMKKNGRAQKLIYDAREIYTELPAVAHSPIKKRIWKTVEALGMVNTDYILLTAPNDADALCKVHNFLPRPIIIRNLPWREPNITPDREALRPLGVPEEMPAVVYIGGLQAARSLPTLIDAMVHIQAQLILIGDGPLRSELVERARQKGVEQKVHFAGPIESNEALRIVAACDVGISLVEPVSESYKLALPSKQFEYMMCGIPIVSSRLKQVIDLFPHEEWIVYVDESSPQSITDGIKRSIESSRNDSIRQSEHERALKDFHFEHDAEKLMKLVETFVA